MKFSIHFEHEWSERVLRKYMKKWLKDVNVENCIQIEGRKKAGKGEIVHNQILVQSNNY